MKQLVDLESMNKLIVVRLDQQFSHYRGILEQIALTGKRKEVRVFIKLILQVFMTGGNQALLIMNPGNQALYAVIYR